MTFWGTKNCKLTHLLRIRAYAWLLLVKNPKTTPDYQVHKYGKIEFPMIPEKIVGHFFCRGGTQPRSLRLRRHAAVWVDAAVWQNWISDDSGKKSSVTFFAGGERSKKPHPPLFRQRRRGGTTNWNFFARKKKSYTESEKNGKLTSPLRTRGRWIIQANDILRSKKTVN